MERKTFYNILHTEFDLNDLACMKLDVIALESATEIYADANGYKTDLNYDSTEHKTSREVLIDMFRDEPYLINDYLKMEV